MNLTTGRHILLIITGSQEGNISPHMPGPVEPGWGLYHQPRGRATVAIVIFLETGPCLLVGNGWFGKTLLSSRNVRVRCGGDSYKFFSAPLIAEGIAPSSRLGEGACDHCSKPFPCLELGDGGLAGRVINGVWSLWCCHGNPQVVFFVGPMRCSDSK